MQYTISKEITAVGNYRIIKFETPFESVEALSTYADNITGEQTTVIYVQREFKWSVDGSNWSLWVPFTLLDLSPLTGLSVDSDKPLYIEFKYTSKGDNTTEIGDEIDPPIIINTIDLTLTYKTVVLTTGYKPISYCSDEKCISNVIFKNKGFKFKPYAVNKGICLYKDLSKMVNNMFGIDTQYFKVDSDKRSKDVILREYTLYNITIEKCIKVMVPDNVFPDSKPNFNDMGIVFEQPFEVHIDKAYYEEIFGAKSRPQKRDIIFIPITNRIYEIESTYLFRDFMQEGVYYKVLLVKYQPKSNTKISTDIKTELEELTISSDDLFGAEIKEEMEKITKPLQYPTISVSQDSTRQYINKEFDIVRYDLYNNWTLMSEYYYDGSSLYDSVTPVQAIKYRAFPSFTSTGNMSYTSWIQPTGNAGIVRNLLNGHNGTNGMKIEFIFNGETNISPPSVISATLNSTVFTSSISGFIPLKNKWYGVVVNMSNQFKQIGFFIYGTKVNSNELELLHKDVQSLSSVETFSLLTEYELIATPQIISNIRLYEAMVEEENHNVVLSQMIVDDSQLALIIDNCRPQLKLARIKDPK